MRKFFMAIIAIMMTASVSAQFYIYLSNGDVLEADSISTVAPTPGSLSGKFSVSDTKKVHFSQGNLQYVGTWQFAEHQWDTIGNAQADNNRDLFGWGTGNNPNNISTDYNDYATYVEWGDNPITNGGNKANIWRTLTKDEWVYLFYGRSDAAQLFSLGKVNGVNGTILLPDNWSGEKYDNATNGLTDQGSYYYNSNGTNFSFHTYDGDAWKAMEKAGAVFLPAAGNRSGTDVDFVGSYGSYWSATPSGTYNARFLDFGSYDLGPQYGSSRDRGRSVRLVR